MNTTIEKTQPQTHTLADLRNAKGMSTRQVADVMGLSQPRITQIEGNGKVSIDQLRQLAGIYEVSFEEALDARDATCALSNK